MTDLALLRRYRPAERAASDPELRYLTRRFRLAVRLTLLVVVAALGDRIPGVPLAYIAPPRFWIWFQLVLSTPVVLWSGAPFFRAAARSTRNRRWHRHAPVAIAVAAVWIFSAVAALAPALFTEPYWDESGFPRVYFEVATVIVTLALVERLIEAYTLARPAAATSALRALLPRKARRLRADGLEEEVQAAEVQEGDPVRVWAGETVPLDGVVLEGKSAVDDSRISGAAQAIERAPGDVVIGGAVNRDAPLVVRVTAAASETLAARLIRILDDAVREPAPIVRRADRWATWVVRVAVAISLLTFTAWSLLGPEPRFAVAMLSAVAVLAVAAPSAFVLAAAAPIAFAIVRGTQAGIVFNHPAAIERLADAGEDDLAGAAAGVTLVDDDPRAILRARRLARATMRIVEQNLLFVFLYNALGVAVAAGVLYPYFGLLLDPMIAAAAMSLSSASVIGNALRLRLARI